MTPPRSTWTPFILILISYMLIAIDLNLFHVDWNWSQSLQCWLQLISISSMLIAIDLNLFHVDCNWSQSLPCWLQFISISSMLIAIDLNLLHVDCTVKVNFTNASLCFWAASTIQILGIFWLFAFTPNCNFAIKAIWKIFKIHSDDKRRCKLFHSVHHHCHCKSHTAFRVFLIISFISF